MTMPTEDADDHNRAYLKSADGAIEFKDVWFEYRKDVPVIKGVSFVAPEGTTTALVGSSGSGKSTLISLIMAFERPMRGQILLAGRDLQAVRLKDYRKHLGVVLQDNFLFDGTIAENIAYGRPNATREQIIAAARAARAHEFILRQPDGYDSFVGERGMSLSGGERQRISIARALLIDPAILILDEATSAVDTETEREIQLALENLTRGRTTIADRKSTRLNSSHRT